MNSTRQFARNASALSFTSALRIVLNLALRFAILAYLGEIGFGQYSIFVAYTTVFQVVAELGLPRLVIREGARRREQIGHYWRTALLAEFFGALLAGVLMVAVTTGLHYSSETSHLLLIGALLLLPYIVVSVTEACCQALERMEIIAVVQGIAVGVQVIGSIATLALHQGVIGLGLVALATQGLAALLYLAVAKRIGLLEGETNNTQYPIGHTSLLTDAWRLVHTAPTFFALAVSNVMFNKLDTLMLSVLLGEALTGVYNAIYLIVQVINLLVVGYTDALYPRLARLYSRSNQARFSEAMHQALRFGLLALIPVALATSLLAAPIVGILYHGSLRISVDARMQAVNALHILSWFALPFLINAVLGGALLASGRQRASLAVSLGKLAAAILYYQVGIRVFGIIGAAAATLATGLTAIILNWFYVTRDLASVRWGQLLLKPLAASAIMGLAMLALSWPLGNSGWAAPLADIDDLAIVALAGMIIYLVTLITLRGFTAADRNVLRSLFSRRTAREEGI